MAESRQHRRTGVGLITVVQVVFLILKLTDLINWPWLWVIAPTIIRVAWWGVMVGLWLIMTDGDDDDDEEKDREGKESGQV